MSLTVVSVAYPLAPIAGAAAGGAEQVLARIDEDLVRRGHRSIVIACSDSEVAGELIMTPREKGVLDEGAIRRARARHRLALESTLSRVEADVVHYHGVDFRSYDVDGRAPRIATLHLPPDWYPREIFDDRSLDLVCVSEAQRRAAPHCDRVVGNGVDLAVYRPGEEQDYFLALGRICPEKNLHAAVEAARRADVRLLVAGAVAQYPAHLAYYENEFLPRLDARREFIGVVEMPAKQALMAGARAVIIPSTVKETSSIVAMEALACGTPVIAYRSGALPEIVTHGVTGFIVDSLQGLAEAMKKVESIDRRKCREVAEERFDAKRMAAAYIALYEVMAKRREVAGDGRSVPGRVDPIGANHFPSGDEPSRPRR